MAGIVKYDSGVGADVTATATDIASKLGDLKIQASLFKMHVQTDVTLKETKIERKRASTITEKLEWIRRKNASTDEERIKYIEKKITELKGEIEKYDDY